MTKKIRILNVVHCMERGGTEAFLMNYFRKIDKSKFDVDFVILSADDSPYRDEIERLGGHIYFPHLSCALKNVPKFIPRFTAYIKDHGPYDIVHSHINLDNAWTLMAAKRAGVRKRISHSHNTNIISASGIKRLIQKFQAMLIPRYATELWACGQDAGKDLYGASKGFTEISNGIDFAYCSTCDSKHIAELVQEFNLDNATPVVTSISRFDSQKNLEFAIRIFAEIIKKAPEAKLIIGGGDGVHKKACIDLIEKLGIAQSVVIIGPRSDVRDILHLTDFYIMPSRYEGFGIMSLEVQASGTPIFLSDRCPKDSDMGLGLAHFISLDKSPTEWADEILRTPKPNLSASQIQRAFESRGYDISHNARKLESLYER